MMFGLSSRLFSLPANTALLSWPGWYVMVCICLLVSPLAIVYVW